MPVGVSVENGFGFGTPGSAQFGENVWDTAELTGFVPEGATIEFEVHFTDAAAQVCNASTLATTLKTTTGAPLAGGLYTTDNPLKVESTKWKNQVDRSQMLYFVEVRDSRGREISRGKCGDEKETVSVVKAAAVVSLALTGGTIAGGLAAGGAAPEEQKLIVWNSLVAHHQGLASTQKSFTRSFNTLNEEPLFELHRNFSNFDNEVVAAKAWNRLFALLDWREARIQASKPAPVEPTLLDSLKRMGKIRAQKKALDEWRPRSSSVAEDGLSTVELEQVTQAAIGLLDAWKDRNYGVLAGYLHEFGKKAASRSLRRASPCPVRPRCPQ